MTPTTAPPLLADVEGLPPVVEVGTTVPLQVLLTNPAAWGQSVRLFGLHLEPGPTRARLDTDLFDCNTVIRPGESYRLCLPLTAVRPGRFELAALTLQVRRGEAVEPVPLPARALIVVPSLAAEIALVPTPLVRYDLGTRVRLRVAHRGETTWRDFRLGFGLGVLGGPQVVRRDPFAPGDAFEVELFAEATDLVATLEARTELGPVRAMKAWRAEPPPAADRKPFVFLQPNALVDCKTQLFTLPPDGPPRPVHSDRRGAYRLSSGGRYRLAIEPGPGVRKVVVHDTPQLVQSQPDRVEAGSWLFTLEVTGRNTFSKRRVVRYTVEGDKTLHGEIPVAVKPTPTSQLVLAATLGGALMIQGGMALFALLSRAFGDGIDWADVFAGFTLAGDMNWWRLLAGPLIFCGLLAGDAVAEQFQE